MPSHFLPQLQAALPTLTAPAVLAVAKLTAYLCVSYIAWRLFMLFVYLPLTDPLARLPGPTGSYFQNHFRQVLDPRMSMHTHREWKARYGKTFRFHGFGRHDYRLMSFDFSVISHVLTNPIYEKPWQTRSFLSRLIGRGIFTREGHEHKVHRRIIAPAFSHMAVKNLSPIMEDKAHELADCLKTQSATETVDVLHWISRASFDVMGLAGFGYSFSSLSDESEPVYSAYRRMFTIAEKGLGMKGILCIYFPILRTLFPDEDIRTHNACQKVISAAKESIVAKKRAEIERNPRAYDAKDILTLLIKSNLCTDSARRLSDSDLLDQCSTLLLAGSDSVSVALAWCLHLLALHPHIQERLRNATATALAEAKDNDCSSDDSGFLESAEVRARSQRSFVDIVDGIHFLDCVIRETLRFAPPVHSTIRVATKDDKIPITHPIHLPDGSLQKGGHISIRKGTFVQIPFEGLNHSPEIWGDDAGHFNPSRWSTFDDSGYIPTKRGMGSLMSFSSGPHACLGQRFSILQMKIFLATLVTKFTFTPAPEVKVVKCNTFLTKPFIANQWSKGPSLPLVVQYDPSPILYPNL